MSTPRLATGTDTPVPPTWLSLGPDLREHATRWTEQGPMTIGAYVDQAPPYGRAEWRRSCKSLRHRGALVRRGREWVCVSPPDDFAARRISSTAPQMDELNETARALASVFRGYAKLDPVGREWVTFTQEQLQAIWNQIVVPLHRWRHESGDHWMNGGGLARELHPIMVQRGFKFRDSAPAVKLVGVVVDWPPVEGQ